MNILNNIQDESLYIGYSNFKDLAGQTIKLKNAMVIYCSRGSAKIEIDMCQYELCPDMQTIILPNSIIHIHSFSAELEVVIIAFSSQLFWEASTPLNPMFFEQIRKMPCLQLTDRQDRYIKSFIAAIENCQLNRDNIYWQTVVRNIIQCFLLDIADMNRRFQLEHPNTCTRPEELFKNFVQLISKHCIHEREVQFYAEKLHVTPRYLSAAIRKVSGYTAKGMIDKHVILEIKILLKNTNLTVQEIASKLDFPNQSFCSRYFKKYTGVTPLQYRKKV